LHCYEKEKETFQTKVEQLAEHVGGRKCKVFRLSLDDGTFLKNKNSMLANNEQEYSKDNYPSFLNQLKIDFPLRTSANMFNLFLFFTSCPITDYGSFLALF
jgi:hypothetical protein